MEKDTKKTTEAAPPSAITSWCWTIRCSKAGWSCRLRRPKRNCSWAIISIRCTTSDARIWGMGLSATTRHYGALRAGSGLLLSADGKTDGASTLDSAEPLAQAESRLTALAQSAHDPGSAPSRQLINCR